MNYKKSWRQNKGQIAYYPFPIDLQMLRRNRLKTCKIMREDQLFVES